MRLMERTVTFYTTPGCSLCETARTLLESYSAYVDFQIREEDILNFVAADDPLAERIPILEYGGHRLYWPFDGATLHSWYQRIGST